MNGETNRLAEIKAVEQQEFERFNRYVEQLDPGGWVEQSYCADWLVFQVVSHLGSGARIGRMRLQAWTDHREPVSREEMQTVWSHFDSLRPNQMLAAYTEAAGEYLAEVAALPDDVGAREVDGFAGRRPLYGYQLSRLWELVCHAWDVYVARDRQARLAPDAVALLATLLQYVSIPVDQQRAAALAEQRVELRVIDSRLVYALDLSGQRPRLVPGPASSPTTVIEGPADELVRFVSGRHFVPGTTPLLRASSGDLAAVKRAFRP
jgi:uncharacterized protein (TIGR03083 family)